MAIFVQSLWIIHVRGPLFNFCPRSSKHIVLLPTRRCGQWVAVPVRYLCLHGLVEPARSCVVVQGDARACPAPRSLGAAARRPSGRVCGAPVSVAATRPCVLRGVSAVVRLSMATSQCVLRGVCAVRHYPRLPARASFGACARLPAELRLSARQCVPRGVCAAVSPFVESRTSCEVETSTGFRPHATSGRGRPRVRPRSRVRPARSPSRVAAFPRVARVSPGARGRDPACGPCTPVIRGCDPVCGPCASCACGSAPPIGARDGSLREVASPPAVQVGFCRLRGGFAASAMAGPITRKIHVKIEFARFSPVWRSSFQGFEDEVQGCRASGGGFIHAAQAVSRRLAVR